VWRVHALPLHAFITYDSRFVTYWMAVTDVTTFNQALAQS
jgi:hypothetical protein